jgi:hypothetical protein
MAGMSGGTRPRIVRVAAGLGIGLVALLLLGVLASRLVDLRYVNVPLVHPYPPTGYAQNPFNPTDHADLIPTAEAATVRADLLADGKIEIDALATGDGSHLGQAETGPSLQSALSLLQSNAAHGIFQTTTNRLDRVEVGRLADPNNAAATWCVEEQGTATLTFLRRDSGAVASTQTIAFTGRFWLIKVGARYLILDRLVTVR